MMSGSDGSSFFDSGFSRLIHQLNAAQKAAIAAPDGPTLVLAGPGTGKTQLIAAKVGTILTESDTLPRSILCLTFTDAGVHALRNRLIQFMGPEGHKVQVLTYHSFCNQIIQQHRYYFGQNYLEPLSDLERIDIIRMILNQLPWDHPLKKGYFNAYQFEGEWQSLIRLMKKEHYSPEKMIAQIDAYCELMPALPEFRYKRKQGPFLAGDLKTGMYEDFLQKYTRLREAVKLFDVYEREKLSRNRYDYEDMILWVLKKFREKPAFLSLYQEQFLYVLLDEFQDTNGAQFELIQTLLNYWDTPNLFIVGDEDQSIYEFQGARMKHLQDIQDTYGDALHLVQLKENYRATQGMLHAAFAFIRRNSLRSSLKKELEREGKPLIAANPRLKTDTKPLIVAYGSIFQEEADLVNKLKQLFANGVNPAQVAVLYRNNRQGDRLVTLFEKNRIPYHTSRPINVLQTPVIFRILRILQYLVQEWKETDCGAASFLPLMYHPHWEISVSDIGKLNKFKLTSDLSWHEIMADETIWISLEVETIAAIRRFALFIQDALKQGQHKPIPVFLESLIHKSGLLKATLKQKDRIYQVQILNTFLNFCEKSVEREPNMHLIDWMLQVERMQENQLSVTLEMPQVSKERVQLLTAHRSKGLEFDYVFMYDCVQSEWEGKSSHGGEFSFPPTIQLEPETDRLEASRRLFYVGMTRAAQFLQISYGTENANGKERMPSLFISELLEDALVDFEQKTVPAADMQEIQENRVKPTLLPPALRPDKAFIDHRLESFVLTVSAMNRYLECPLSFFYRDVLGIPAVKNAPAAYGTAIHDAIFEYTSGLKYSKNRKTEEKKLAGLFEKHLKKSRSWFSKSAWEDSLQRGTACLTEFAAHCDPDLLQHSRPEFMLSFTDREGFTYKGVLDRVDYLKGGKVHIIDYKTGKPRRGAFQKPSWKGNTPYGGVYWRQLAFYHLIFEGHSREGFTVEESKLMFLEEDAHSSFREVVLTPESDDLMAFKNLMQEVSGKIRSNDFYTGCSNAHCIWCHYLKNEMLPGTSESADQIFLDDGPFGN